MLAWQALSPGAISQPHCLQYFPQLSPALTTCGKGGQHRAGETKAVSIHYTARGTGKVGKCAESKKAPELELGTRRAPRGRGPWKDGTASTTNDVP